MIYDVVTIIFLVLATEATTEIIVASEFPLFYWFRKKLGKLTFPDVPRTGVFQYTLAAIYKLFTCGYCMSVWVAAFFAFLVPLVYFDTLWGGNAIINWFLLTLCIHRLSNWLHIIFELVRRGRVRSYDITLVAREDDESQIDKELILQDQEGESGSIGKFAEA